MRRILQILLGLTLILSSCKYNWAKITDSNGKQYRVREYKTNEDQQKYKARMVFKCRYKPATYSRYSGSISLITIDSFQYVRFDSVRVGLGRDTRQYIDIFSSGLLNSKIIYCMEDSLCRPNEGLEITDVETGNRIRPDMAIGGYKYSINVGLIEEPKYLKLSPKQRRFMLWIDTRGGNGYDVYFVELTNDKVNSYVGPAV